jgi:PHD/YefM family antitoxin component YafN of YafNO toxin-antitoxin module
MTIYTYSEARQKLAALLEQAQSEGEVRIKRRDGQEFIVVPVSAKGSPLDVEGINLSLGLEEIVSVVREGRQRP